MAIKSKFFRRASTSKQSGAAATQIMHEGSAQEEVREEQQVMGSGDHDKTRSEEARDESNPLNDFSIAVATVFADAASVADDVQTVSTADNDDESVVGTGASAVKPASGRVNGSPTTLAWLIKKLRWQQQKLDKAERRIIEAEKEFAKAEAEVMKSRKEIRALSEKFNMRLVLNDIEDDEEFEEELGDVVWNAAGSFSDVGGEILSYAYRLGSTIERTANGTIFPHGVDDTVQ